MNARELLTKIEMPEDTQVYIYKWIYLDIVGDLGTIQRYLNTNFLNASVNYSMIEVDYFEIKGKRITIYEDFHFDSECIGFKVTAEKLYHELGLDASTIDADWNADILTYWDGNKDHQHYLMYHKDDVEAIINVKTGEIITDHDLIKELIHGNI